MISLTLGTTLEGCLAQLPIEAHQKLVIVAISGVSQDYAAGTIGAAIRMDWLR